MNDNFKNPYLSHYPYIIKFDLVSTAFTMIFHIFLYKVIDFHDISWYYNYIKQRRRKQMSKKQKKSGSKETLSLITALINLVTAILILLNQLK